MISHAHGQKNEKKTVTYFFNDFDIFYYSHLKILLHKIYYFHHSYLRTQKKKSSIIYMNKGRDAQS